ncbi:MAG: carboxypeptidase-like regulatory domain-containing protein [Bacteroidales bacterium]|nr:carboxypeptidase-like regulatory domain-containing protein [Bacteroidales bacterium]
MKKYRFCLSIVLILCGLFPLSAQEILLQWTGVIRNDLLEPVPYVHILVKSDYRGAISDPHGMFTITAHASDTLLISCVGYKLRQVIVPKTSGNDTKHYIKDIILEPDTIMLSEVVIFPWKSYKEFKDAFMALELPEDEMQRAYRNIAIIQEQIYNAIANRPASPTANFRDVMSAQHNRMSNYGHMYPTYMITNPLAWANFFKAIRDGDFKKKDTKDQQSKPSVVDEYIKNNPRE